MLELGSGIPFNSSLSLEQLFDEIYQTLLLVAETRGGHQRAESQTDQVKLQEVVIISVRVQYFVSSGRCEYLRRAANGQQITTDVTM
jgi:hypothetical protein